MKLPTEQTVLEILNEYKWGEDYSCYKCGNTSYKKGKQPFSRRCTQCDYDESLLKLTVFEGSKLPIAKAYAIIEHLVVECEIDFDAKDIAFEKDKRNSESDESVTDRFNEGEALSVNSLLDKYKANEISRAKADKLLLENMDAHSINVSEIARIFEVEENSVSKLLGRISNRLLLIENNNYDLTPAEHIFSVLREGGRGLDYYLGLLMAPMDDTWQNGKKIIDDKSYYTYKAPHPLREDLENTRWCLVHVEIMY